MGGRGAKSTLQDEGKRLEYYPGYYAADVCDPDGYSFEVVHNEGVRIAERGNHQASGLTVDREVMGHAICFPSPSVADGDASRLRRTVAGFSPRPFSAPAGLSLTAPW
jgi:hypothetical protein